MPKPKNDGVLLQVRVSPETHARIARAVGHMVTQGIRPGAVTKAAVIEAALVHYVRYLDKGGVVEYAEAAVPPVS